MTSSPVELFGRYYERFLKGDTETPSEGELKPLSKIFDVAVSGVVNKYMEVLRSAPEHQKRVSLLQDQPRVVGKFSSEKVIFDDISPFEQQVALCDYLAQTEIRRNHTFFMGVGEDDHIPVRIKKFAGIETTMMHVLLGTTRGDYKAPKYTDWAESDPREDDSQKRFIAPLESLEIVRQPEYSAGTVIKGNAFEKDLINSTWRYGSTYACVEDKGQSKGGEPKKTGKKEISAGLNAAALVKKFSNDTDPIAKEKNICLPIQYEDYSNEGYKDDLSIKVSPGAMIKAANEALVNEDTTTLERHMEGLVIAKLGAPSTPKLRKHVADRISDLGKNE